MTLKIAKRMSEDDFQGTFVNMMLEVASKPSVISFAGGLPNPISFPIKEIEEATKKVLDENGVRALQYSSTQGYLPLREFIAGRYQKFGLKISADDILITNGSQQALDIIAAVLLDYNDTVVVEDPTYLAALQTFHLYRASIETVTLEEDGINIESFEKIIEKKNPKFFYLVPNFQNPTGLTYKNEKRKIISDILLKTDTLLFEDNPYGELRFKGENQKSFYSFLGEQACLIGTFSKTVSPGMRIGWLAISNKTLRDKMIKYKQLVDMHTNIFGQMVLATYLQYNDYDKHIEKIKTLYKHQSDKMIECIDKYFPKNVAYTKPEGGMFIWVTLPEGKKAITLSELASKENIAIAAGDPFYETTRGGRSFRLNYTNSDDTVIEKGIKTLGDIIKTM